MQQNPKSSIIEVLAIIGYEDNKETYADEFIQNCEKQALIDIIMTLPQEQQERFKQHIAETAEQERQKAIIDEYVSPEQYRQALQKASHTAFRELLETVAPTLTNDQVAKLQFYMKASIAL